MYLIHILISFHLDLILSGIKINESNDSTISKLFMDLDIDFHKGHVRLQFCICSVAATFVFLILFILAGLWWHLTATLTSNLLISDVEDISYMLLKKVYILFEKVLFRTIIDLRMGNSFRARTQDVTEILLSWAMYSTQMAHFLLFKIYY